jgi:uncharacterized membrane protein
MLGWFKKGPSEIKTRLIEFREGVVETMIEAPPEVVWKHHGDVKKYNCWSRMYRITDSVERLEKPGDWYDYELTVLGIPVKGRMVSCYRVLHQRTEGALISQYRGGGSWKFEPLPGGTRLIWTIWSEMPRSYLGKAVDQLLIAETTQSMMQDNLARFKAYVEGKPPPGEPS